MALSVIAGGTATESEAGAVTAGTRLEVAAAALRLALRSHASGWAAAAAY
eukprot:SAG31_NODE_8_length_42345_cov_10.980992_6_plen_50_part_00